MIQYVWSLEDHIWHFLNILWSEYFYFKYFTYLAHIFLLFRFSIFFSSYKTNIVFSIWFFVFFFFPTKGSRCKTVKGILKQDIQAVGKLRVFQSIWSITSFQPSLLMVQIFATFSSHFLTSLILISKEQHNILMKIWNLVSNYILLTRKPFFNCLGCSLALPFTWYTDGRKKQLFLQQKCDSRSRTPQYYS